MSTTTLCQRVQHSFDPKLVEPWQIQLLFPSRCSPRPVSSKPESSAFEHNSVTVKLSNINIECSMKNTCKSGYLGGWSFLQSLSNPTQTLQIDTDTDTEKVYQHPLAKRSKSGLSEKSLEMCTESLGSETGSTIAENADDVLSSISICDREKSTRSMRCYRRKRMSRVAEFPPPLSTMRSGGCSSGVQVESVREDGRLVIKAVNVTATSQSCFMAERRDGTLKLRFVHDENDDDDDDDDNDDEDDIMYREYEDEIENKSGNNVRNEMEELDGVRRTSKCKESGGGGG
ncbi:protein FANTASTIC FOUR 4 [Silene latifolia]|uniref:protein FANTASTIC FOUR 4 n=1 Tax=Silene latifolia TaxID=37657 RepID=UPI003D7755A1